MIRRFGNWLLVLALCVCGCRRELPEQEKPYAKDGSQSSTTTTDATQTPVNPTWLFEPPPKDKSKIDWDATLRLTLRGNPNTLNPVLMSSVPEEKLKELLFDYPFVFDSKFQWSLNPAMTESFVIAPDGLSALLILKEGLTWHDGTPLTASDVVFSWAQILDEKVPARAARSGTDQIVSCNAVDRRTVSFGFAKPYATNRWSALFALIPKHIYQQGKADDPSLSKSEYYAKHNRAPIGNGPYRFVSWESDNRIVLERWDDYPGPRPHFAKIILRIIPDAQARLLAFEHGDVDETELSPEQFANGTDTASFRTAGVKGFGSQWRFNAIAFNMTGSNPFFSDKRVRQAICHAMNYEQVVSQVFHGLAKRSHGIFHPDSPMYNDDITPYAFDLKRSASLLDKAGWKIDPNDGWRYKSVDVNGQRKKTRFSFTINLPQPSSTSPSVANILAEDLKKIGVEMKSRVLEWSTFLEQLRNREFEACTLAWSAPVDPDYGWSVWHSTSHPSERNYCGYANDRVDALFEMGRTMSDQTTRMGRYAEMSKIIYEDAPYVFLVHNAILWGFSKDIRGVSFSPRGPFQFEPGVRHWWKPASQP